MVFEGEYLTFYEQCLGELQARKDWTEAYVPMLERYVLISIKAQQLGVEIVDSEVSVEHTNKAKQTNKVTSPDWRMFLALNKEAALLARELKLSPANAPSAGSKKQEKKGFDLGNKMKVA